MEQVDRASKRLSDRFGDELPPQVLQRPPIPIAVTKERAEVLFKAGGSQTELERTIGSHDLVDEFYLERCLIAAKPVGRIAVRDDALHTTGFGTGFLVSPRLLLTNWHVFKQVEDARNSYVQFDYTYAINGDEVEGVIFDLDVGDGGFYYANRELDCALVAVKPVSRDKKRAIGQFGYHRLDPNPWKITPPEWITIIQHPNGSRRQFAIRENELLANPKAVIGAPLDGDFLHYRSDTAPGSSGAPAFNDSFQVVALHHSGKAKKRDGKFVLRDQTLVDSIEGVDESQIQWVANEGVRVSVLCKHFEQHLEKRNAYVVQLLNAIHGEHDIMSNVMRRGNGRLRTGNVEVISMGDLQPPLTRDDPDDVERAPTVRTQVTANGTTLQIPLTLHLTVSLTADQPAIAASSARTEADSSVEGEEKIVFPPVDTDYTNRKGYDEGFLGVKVPHPTPTKKASLAKMDDDEVIIPYEHYSVVMNKKRRLALYSISNVHGDATKRKPEAGKKYTRAALGDLKTANDKEGWVTDERIRESDQLPERFYDLDGKAFDKGHLVRREDMCWGDSYDQIKKANADTFHTTNCTPQVAKYNRSQFYGLWGVLENEVLAQVKGDKYTVIAGPVLDDKDKWFDGKDLKGKIRIQIPTRFWKVIVTMAGAKLQAFAFLLEQDLKGIKLHDDEDEDFEVPAQFAAKLVSLKQLEKSLELKFPQALHDADQYGQDGGEEVLKTSSARRGVRDDASAEL